MLARPGLRRISGLQRVASSAVRSTNRRTWRLTRRQLHASSYMASKDMADGRAAASTIVGALEFKRPKVPVGTDKVDDSQLHVVKGIRGEMPYVVKVSKDAGDFHKLSGLVDNILHNAEQIFSSFMKHSEVSRLNATPRGEPFHLSPEMQKVLAHADTVHRLSKGSYDPACAPLINYYKKELKDTLRTFNLTSVEADPRAAEIATYAKWESFIFSQDKQFVTKTHSEAAVDLGGIAKGWAIDEIVDALRKAGASSAYVDWGGDIRLLGFHPTGRPWMVNIIEPPTLKQLTSPTPQFSVESDGPADPNQQYLVRLALHDNMAITTSGDYMQVFWRSDRLFHHIFSPVKRRLMQVSSTSLAQASVVVQGSCMMADALSTTAMAMGDLREARKLLDQLGSFSVPVADYLLYAREGPRVVRRRMRGSESDVAREARLSQHVKGAKVVVVGGGLAGYSAAIEAASVGAKVTLLEKEAKVGGNSAKATSGINGWGTRPQATEMIHDEERNFERDTFRSGKGGVCLPSLVRLLSTKSADAIQWLSDEMGVNLSELSQLGGHSRKRTHRAPPTHEGDPWPIGWVIMESVKAYAAERYPEDITVITGAKATSLQVTEDEDDEKVVGLKPRRSVRGVTYVKDGGEAVELSADAVVLATGGYGCDLTQNSLLKEYRPDLIEGLGSGRPMPSTNGGFATGDGVKMGRAAGATLVDMDKVQLHPTSFLDPKDPLNPTKVLGPEALRGSGGILVNQQGKRFVNELDLRSVVAGAILKHCDAFKLPDGSESNRYAWCIMNKEAQKKFGLPSLKFYKDNLGLFESAPDFTSLARDVIGCDPKELRATIDEYELAIDHQIDLKFRKNVFPARFHHDDKDLVAARVTPSIHYTMGGLRITPQAEVLEEVGVDSKGLYRKLRPIRGLFAAGEVTGGVHGANRLGGNSLLECVVFGRVAGERAGTVVQQKKVCLKEDDWVPVTLREVLETDQRYGTNTKVFRFNLHGSLQYPGLDVGQFVGIRGELDGEIVQGFYSPVSRPGEQGFVEILCRTDTSAQIIHFLNDIRPGTECYLRAMGGLRLKFEGHRVLNQGREIKRIGLLAGGTGIAPMIQILRAFLHYQVGQGTPGPTSASGVKLVYAAERQYDLCFTQLLQDIREKHNDFFNYYVVLNQPPLGWTEGVGYVEHDTIKKHLPFPPQEHDLIVICGPPFFEALMCKTLHNLGYPRHTYFAYSNAEH